MKHFFLKAAFNRKIDLENKTINVEDFNGTALLSGVEENEIPSGDLDATTISFILDSVVFTATEDPSDGYRSMLKDITFSFDKKLRNTFRPIEVELKFTDTESSQILRIRDVKSKKFVLEIGTKDTDDYYPMFIGRWNPKNLYINIDK